jgi:signal transduction histidine kinase
MNGAVPASEDQWLVCIQAADAADADAYRTWGLMARRVAHDLKNPLTSMLLTLQRLQMEYRDRAPDVADDLDAYTARIEERIEYLRRMTKNVMKFIDAETPTLARTDLNAYLDARIDLLRSGLPPDIHLRTKKTPDLPPVRIDAEQMESVLENLIGNAVNAMPEGGQITIATRLEQGLRLGLDASPRDYVEVEVLDTGVGMEDTVLERLFEPGFTTSEDGTGLGLAIVQKVIRDHGGHIHVESERGTGSAIGLFLPVDRGDAEPPA